MTTSFAVRETQLFDAAGQRLYLCRSEDARFLDAALRADRPTRLFCELLSYTGCRLSEGLATTPRLLDAAEKQVVFRTLKRRKTVFRAVPIPASLMRELVELARDRAPDERLWSWSRQTGWRRVKAIMAAADITGVHASPRGIRHKFGVSGISHKLPETMLQELMGHAKLSSTAIYVKAVGREKRALVRRMWPTK